MAKKFSDLRAKMTPEAQKRANVMAQTMLAEMPLNELRQARGLSQKMLAEVRVWQPPSDDHEGLKRFMAEQLSMSIGEPERHTTRVPRKSSTFPL